LTSELCLGDEVHHYRFAKLIYQTGKRVAEDPLYANISFHPKYLFVSPPLWHILLVILWKLTGGISFIVAKIYHSFYYALLILFTYFLAKELYTEKEAWYSAIIIATVPMIISFSILFYTDIPLTVFTVLCLLMILKNKYLIAGIIAGLMYLTKTNALFFIPIFIFVILYYNQDTILKKIRYTAYFLATFACFLIPDMWWRNINLKSSVVSGFSRLVKTKWNFSVYLNSYLTNPVDLVRYLGMPLLIFIALYIIFKRYQKKDLFLWIPIIGYLLISFYFFNFNTDIRYFMPIIPLVVILASKSLILLDKKWIKIAFFIICFFQLIVTLAYVNITRRIPQGIKEGFNFIKQNISPDALIMYPEENLIEMTERRILWGDMKKYQYLFWLEEDEKAKYIIKSHNIDYIAVKKSRIYNDSKGHHYGGYSKTLIEKLPTYDFLKLVFENKEIAIWKVMGGKLK
ncbi:MAG: glycosyltransferase family 39 protein, partial [Candidatus Omnitrophota bacterium]